MRPGQLACMSPRLHVCFKHCRPPRETCAYNLLVSFDETYLIRIFVEAKNFSRGTFRFEMMILSKIYGRTQSE